MASGSRALIHFYTKAGDEGYAKDPKDITITEKAPTRIEIAY